MRTLLRWLLWMMLALGALVLAYVAYASWAWRDIPVNKLEQRYGDAHLKTAEIDGVPLRYRLQGPEQAPVLVLIHSHFFDMGIWDAWIPTLTHHYRVLRYDLSGHGLTGPDPTGDYRVQRDVDLLRSLLAKLQIDTYAVVGSSLGGNIAFTLAAQRPQNVTALVLINSGGLKRQSRGSGRGIPAWADRVFPLVPPLALERFLEWMIADDRVIDAVLKTRFVDMWRRDGNRAAELARLRQFESGNPDALLARITAPTLILWGEDNPQLPVALASEFQRRLSAAATVEVHTYAGAGHVLPLERPTASADATVQFLQSLTASVEAVTP